MQEAMNFEKRQVGCYMGNLESEKGREECYNLKKLFK